MTTNDPIIEAAAEAVYAEERNQSMGFDAWPGWSEVDEENRGPFEEIARAVVDAVIPLMRQQVADEIKAGAESSRRGYHWRAGMLEAADIAKGQP